MRRITLLVIALCLVLLFTANKSAGQTPMYTVTDLGTLGGPISVAMAINASGEVVGWSETGMADPTGLGTITHAFRTQPNSPIDPVTDDLGTLGGLLSWAYGINDVGQVVGTSYIATPPGTCCTSHAFRTAPHYPINASTDDLGTMGGIGSVGYGINNEGQVVGAANTSALNCLGTHGLMWQGSYAYRTEPNEPIKPRDNLGTLGGTCFSLAYAVNDAGEAVGLAMDATTLHAFRTGPDRKIKPANELGSFTGNENWATAINNLGQVVGVEPLTGACCFSELFEVQPNQPLRPAHDDLGKADQAIFPAQPSPYISINNLGQLVGGSPAFVSAGGARQDLNSLIPADSGWSLVVAMGINDAGQIVGMGAPPDGGSGYGVGRAYLLTPIYSARVEHPIREDGHSVFRAGREALPVRFALHRYDARSCDLLPATIQVTRTEGRDLGPIDRKSFSTHPKDGLNFKMETSACRYAYDLDPTVLGEGTYRVDLVIQSVLVGHATFALKDRDDRDHEW